MADFIILGVIILFICFLKYHKIRSIKYDKVYRYCWDLHRDQGVELEEFKRAAELLPKGVYLSALKFFIRRQEAINRAIVAQTVSNDTKQKEKVR